jgi:hypothetical protein
MVIPPGGRSRRATAQAIHGGLSLPDGAAGPIVESAGGGLGTAIAICPTNAKPTDRRFGAGGQAHLGASPTSF